MAWFGENFKSLSSQLTTAASTAAEFTRGVLEEGTTEVSDHATELKITEDKVERLEAAIVSLKAENERLQLINSDLEEKAETSELQINSISSQYRGVIQEKEDEIKSLKEEQHKWQSQSFQTDSMMIASSPPALATSTSTSSLSSSALLVPGDNDFHDIITAQQEINKMSAELSRLQAECDHWKQMASSKVQPSFQVGAEEATSDSDAILNARIKELESKLQREIDESQHELSALQDVHSQKLANMARQHKSEIEKYKEKVEQLEEDLMYAQDGQSAGDKKESDGDTLRQKLQHIQKELDKTKEDLVEMEAANSELQSEVEKLKLKERQSTKQRKDLQGKIIQITKDNEELSIEKEKLLQSLEDKTKDTEKMKMAIANEDTASKELELLKRTLQEREKELEEAHLTVEQVSEELLATKRRLLASLDDNHMEEGQRSVEDLEAASQEVQDETVDLISRMGKTENTKAVEENSRLTAQVSRLQTELEELNARCASLSSDKEHSEMMIAKLNQDIQYLKEGKDLPPDLSSRTDSTIGYSTDTQSAASDVSHDTNQGSALGMEGNSDTQSFDGEFDDSHIFATIRQRFPEAASAMQEQLVQFEEIQRDWEMEKEALEQVVISVREQLKQKEQALQNLKQSQDQEMSEKVSKEMEDLHKQLGEAETSQKKVTENLELANKEKERLAKEIDRLQRKNESLSVEVSEAEREKQSLQQQLEKSVQNIEQLQDELNHTMEILNEKDQSVLEMSQQRDELQEDMKQLDLQQREALDQILLSKKDLEQEVDNLKEQLKDVGLELEESKRKLDEKLTSSETAEQLKKELIQVKEKFISLEKEKNSEVDELKQEVDVLKETKETFEESNTILIKSNRLLEEEKSALQAKLKALKERGNVKNDGEDSSEVIAKMEEECLELKKHADRLQDKCSELETTLAKTQHEKISLREELSRKTNVSDKLSQELKKVETRLVEVENKKTELEKENLNLKEDVEEIHQKMQEQLLRHEEALMEITGNETGSEFEVMKAEREKQLELITQKDTEITELKLKCEELQVDLSGTKDALNTTVSNHEQLADLLKEKESDIRSLAEENAFFLEAVKEGKESKSELNDALRKISVLEQEVGTLRTEKVKLEERVADLQEIEQKSLDESRTLGLITDLEFEIGDLKTGLAEKDSIIQKLKEELSNTKVAEDTTKLESDLALKQEAISSLEQEKETFKNKCALLEEQLQASLEETKEHGGVSGLKEELEKKITECEQLKSENLALDDKLKLAEQKALDQTSADENWKTQVDDLQREIDIYDESLKDIQEKRILQESKIKKLMEQLEAKDAEVTQLTSERETLNKMVSEKTNRTIQLQEEVDNLKNFVQSEQSEDHVDGGDSFPDLQTIGHMNGSSVPVQSNLEPLAISDSEKQLEKMIQERDREITALKEQNQAVMTLLDDKSRTIMGNSVLVDLHKVQMQKKSLESERNQMVAVLNEKTRECSNLKTEVHKLMKIVSAEKSALEKAQDDYKELQKSIQTPRNDMQKEALQNLSYLIQEKDLEIGALKQKNDTLVQVLQTASPNNSTEINKVLEDKEELQKENKMLKEERDQLVVSIHQKHHESVTYYEEVQRLAGVINQDSQKYIDLQKRYESLSEEKELKDQSLLEFQGQLEEKRKAVEDLERQLESHKQTFADFELQLADMNESVMSLEKEKESLEEEVRKKESSIGLSKDESKQEEEIKMLKEELQRLKNGQAQIQEEVMKTEVESEGAAMNSSDIIEEAEIQMNSQSQGVDKESKAKEEEIKRLQVELDKLQVTLTDRNERINEKTNEALQRQSEVAKLRQQVDLQNQTLLEHERIIQEKMRDVETLQQGVREKDRMASLLQSQAQNLSHRVSPLEAEVNSLKEENKSLHHSVVNKDAENRSLQDMSNNIAMQLREKEFELAALKEKNKTLTQLVKEKEAGSKGDVERMLQETEAMQRQAQMFQQERDQAVLMLQRNEMDMSSLRKEVQTKAEVEKKLNSELDRLRNHLIEMEETYMSEALQAEEREKDLRNRLALTEDNLRSSSTAVQSASQQASNQIENLLDQLASATNEKEQVLLELAASQEQCQQYSTSLGNLQMVLEQFQQEKEEIIAQEVEIYQRRAEEKEKIAEHLFKQNMEVQQKLSDTQDALESASRLTEQLDKKEEYISRLKQEISKREEEVNEYKKQFDEVSSAAETKVDKPLVKNLFINYVNAPTSKKGEVSHLITSLLNFNQEELDKLHGVSSSGWFSGIFGGRSAPPPSPRHKQDLEKSFTQQFVRFLEEESTPVVKVRLPVEEMTKDRPKPPAFNPFSAPVPSQSPFIPSSPPAKKSLGTVGSSQLMINPTPVTPSVPQSVQMKPVPPTANEGGSGRNSPAAKGSLRDILQ